MATLVFDIETVGETWEDMDDTTQAMLSRWIHKTAKSEQEVSSLLADLKENLGFSPVTGKIVALGVCDLERNQTTVYYTGQGSEGDEEVDGVVLKQRTEKEMLENFWEGAKSYDTFVTFNGRSFDVPFLLHRSIAHEVLPTVDLMEGRYLYQQKGVHHVDLQDQLTFYGTMSKKPSLHLFCRAYGIESPKGEGIGGDDVAQLFAQKQFKKIALYNGHDVTATAVLYEKWLTYLAPTSFKEREIDF